MCLKPCCLNCLESFSLPEEEPYDDGSVTHYDRLICALKRRPVDEDGCCREHPDLREEEV